MRRRAVTSGGSLLWACAHQPRRPATHCRSRGHAVRARHRRINGQLARSGQELQLLLKSCNALLPPAPQPESLLPGFTRRESFKFGKEALVCTPYGAGPHTRFWRPRDSSTMPFTSADELLAAVALHMQHPGSQVGFKQTRGLVAPGLLEQCWEA